MQPTQEDLNIIQEQLGRAPRGVLEISYRTPDGQPAVVKTAPKLDDGTPFPTLYYLTDRRLTAEASRLEGAQVMKWMEARLAEDEGLQEITAAPTSIFWRSATRLRTWALTFPAAACRTG